jgi:REP element-mobilizing transposase RayT
MPRRPRSLVEGGCYHVFARGNQKRAVFRDDEDRRWFLTRLWTVEAESSTIHVGHCLMGNHFHLILIPERASLSRVMHRVLGPYAQWFNRRHAQVGHLFQDRFGSTLLESEVAVLWALRYVHRNPVAAGLVRRAVHWKWSSLRDHLLRRPPDYLVEGARLVRSYVSDDPDFAIADLGSSAETETGADRDAGMPTGRTVGTRTAEGLRVASAAGTRVVGMERLAALAGRVARNYGIKSVTSLRGPARDPRLVAARREFCRLALEESGLASADVAAYLGRSPGQVRRSVRDAVPASPSPSPLPRGDDAGGGVEL